MKLSLSYVLIALLLFCVLTQSSAQILDDSTKLKYSPASVIMQSGQQVYYNSRAFTHPSTSLTGIQSYQPLFSNGVYSQDLGNYLTPRGRVFPVTPSTIGARYGFTAFDDFALLPDSMSYIDTRSPFTSLNYVQGSKGQQHIFVVHSRNITSRWNVTAHVRRMGSRKLLGAVNKTDRQAENWVFGLASRYYSKNSRYHVLVQATSMSLKHYDQGGIVPDTKDSIIEDLYDYNLSKVNLSGVKTTDQRATGRVYHHFNIRKDSSLQIFNQLDFVHRTNQYSDPAPYSATNVLFYPAIRDSSHTADKTVYIEGEAKAGVKGSTSFLFYALYYKARYYKYELPYSTQASIEGLNNIAGGELIAKVHPSLSLGLNGELSAATSEHSAEASLVHKLLDVRYRHMNYRPTLQDQAWDGNHISWSNDFKNVDLHQVTAALRLRYKALTVSPSIQWKDFNNYVYINNVAKPTQTEEALQASSAMLYVAMNKRLWVIENTAQYNYSSDDNLLRVPEFINQTRLLLQGYLFKKATYMQIGVDVFFRSAFVGNRYMPVTQQFYLGNSSDPFNQLPSYALGDVFLTMQVKTVRFFAKMAYVNQGMGSNGYLVTPYYSGMSRTFEFGLQWQFFD